MAAGAQLQNWDGTSRRRVPRYRMDGEVDIVVLRSGVPDTLPARSVNVCERGMAAMVAGELVPGESVGVALQLSLFAEPLQTRATVRYNDKLRCGLEFVALSAEQRASIRDWAVEAKATTEDTARIGPAADKAEKREVEMQKQKEPSSLDRSTKNAPAGPPKRKRRSLWWLIALIVLVSAAAGWWWRWNRGWAELESGLKNADVVSAEKPRAQVPAEVMQKLLVHRVEPVYPADARKQRLEGTIALDIVVGQDGAVIGMRALNGPEVLARAAMDALRWWKFEPYRVNGEPVAVETTVAVEFKH